MVVAKQRMKSDTKVGKKKWQVQILNKSRPITKVTLPAYYCADHKLSCSFRSWRMMPFVKTGTSPSSGGGGLRPIRVAILFARRWRAQSEAMLCFWIGNMRNKRWTAVSLYHQWNILIDLWRGCLEKKMINPSGQVYYSQRPHVHCRGGSVTVNPRLSYVSKREGCCGVQIFSHLTTRLQGLLSQKMRYSHVYFWVECPKNL